MKCALCGEQFMDDDLEEMMEMGEVFLLKVIILYVLIVTMITAECVLKISLVL